jgi:hypothetical protein
LRARQYSNNNNNNKNTKVCFCFGEKGKILKEWKRNKRKKQNEKEKYFYS